MIYNICNKSVRGDFMKYYAVRKGRQIGIYTEWEECKKQVHQFKGAEYKSFNSKVEANNYLGDLVKGEKKKDKSKNITKTKQKDVLYAYVDGSYNENLNVSGYGLVLVMNDKVIMKDLAGFRGINYNEYRNVFGELRGAIKAVELAIANDYKSITIVYDYNGIELFGTGQWKAKKDITKDYQDFMMAYSNIIDINFIKVNAHKSEKDGGDKFNHLADKLAKLSVNLL